MNGLFLTGTNTDVGKTHVGAMIARALVAAGHRVGVYKPVESGCRREGEELIAADARQLWEAAAMPGGSLQSPARSVLKRLFRHRRRRP